MDFEIEKVILVEVLIHLPALWMIWGIEEKGCCCCCVVCCIFKVTEEKRVAERERERENVWRGKECDDDMYVYYYSSLKSQHCCWLVVIVTMFAQCSHYCNFIIP
jgi:hypothetical protein